MRILHSIHSLDLRSGGPSNAIRGLVSAQAAAGHDVSVVATTIQSAEPWLPASDFARTVRDDEQFAGVDVALLRGFGRRPPWNRFGYCPEIRGWLNERFQQESKRPDVIHIHGVFSHINAAAAAAARRHRIPYLVRPTGALDPDCFRTGRHLLKRGFTNLVLGRDLSSAAFIHATSTAEADSLVALTPRERIRVVPLGVQLPAAIADSEAALAVDRFPGTAGKRVILFLSRIAPVKRPELLVEAVARLRKRSPDVVLLFAGQDAGGMAAVDAAIERLDAGSFVLKVGFAEGRDKRLAFALASVFASPSLHENFGVAIVEAMAHGVPVLVTKGVATHVYVDAADCGATVEDDVASIANGLEKLLARDRGTVGGRGRTYVRDHLTWPAVASQLHDLYRESVRRFHAR